MVNNEIKFGFHLVFIVIPRITPVLYTRVNLDFKCIPLGLPIEKKEIYFLTLSSKLLK